MGYYGDEASAAARTDPASCPGAADGSELVGHPLREWQMAEWANTGGARPTLASLRGRVVVVRFWTAGCPFCEKTLPALQKLADELRDQPVTVIGAFHGKPDSSAPDLKKPLELARSWGVSFPIALDREWRTLRSWWLDGHHRHATSVTFVIGKDGRVVHVHPGPIFYPTDDPDQAEINQDYQALRSAVIAAAR
jgi:thiol-disulfide isomerase/thioredoxin